MNGMISRDVQARTHTHTPTPANTTIQWGQLLVNRTYGSFFIWHTSLSNRLVHCMWPNVYGMTDPDFYPLWTACSHSSSRTICRGTFSVQDGSQITSLTHIMRRPQPTETLDARQRIYGMIHLCHLFTQGLWGFISELGADQNPPQMPQ